MTYKRQNNTRTETKTYKLDRERQKVKTHRNYETNYRDWAWRNQTETTEW